MKQGLADHHGHDDERNADEHRARILRFNNELLRDIPHTKEEFIDILADIDFYERYCDEHKGYKNNRASHAIANISRVYDDRLPGARLPGFLIQRTRHRRHTRHMRKEKHHDL